MKWPYSKKYDDPTKDPKYMKDRSELFMKNGNGWWWYQGTRDSAILNKETKK